MIPHEVCKPGEDVYQAAQRRFGENVLVDVMEHIDSKWYIGKVAAHWSGPFFGVYEKTHD